MFEGILKAIELGIEKTQILKCFGQFKAVSNSFGILLVKIISDFQGLLIQVKGLTDEFVPFAVVVCEVIQAGSQFRSILRDSGVVLYQRAANCQALEIRFF